MVHVSRPSLPLGIPSDKRLAGWLTSSMKRDHSMPGFESRPQRVPKPSRQILTKISRGHVYLIYSNFALWAVSGGR